MGHPPLVPDPAAGDPAVPAAGRSDPAAGGPAAPEVRRSGPAVVAIVIGVLTAGVPLGLLWSAVAPGVPIRVTEGDPVFAVAQPEQAFAADAWFGFLAVPFGVLAAVGVWLAARSVRGAPALVALTLGAVGAGVVAWWLGRQVGLAGFQETLAAAEVGTRLERPPDLRVAQLGWWPPQVAGVLLVPGLSAAASYTVLAAWSRLPTLRPDRPDLHDPRNVGDIAGSGTP